MFDRDMSLGELLFDRYSMSDLNAFLLLGGLDAERRNAVMNMVHRLSALPSVGTDVSGEYSLVVLPGVLDGESDFAVSSLEYNLFVRSVASDGAGLMLPGNYSISALLSMNVATESLFLLGVQQFIYVVLSSLYELCAGTSLARPVGVTTLGSCNFTTGPVNWESLDMARAGVSDEGEYWGKVLWGLYGDALFD